MWQTELIHLMKANANPEKAKPMSAYLRNQFTFLGIQTAQRRAICQPFLKLAAEEKKVDWKFLDSCWKEEREFQYIGIEYLSMKQALLKDSDVPKIRKFIVTKSWWDTIDCLDQIVGRIALVFPEVNETLLKWSVDSNFWLRRVAIDHQLTRKEKTNPELLEKIIVNNFGQTEFFVNKAIGWSLRTYSKVNPNWVRCFVEKYRDQLAPLSFREAVKYLP